MTNKQIHINSRNGTIGYGKTYGEKSFNGSPISTSQHVSSSVSSSKEFIGYPLHIEKRGDKYQLHKKNLSPRTPRFHQYEAVLNICQVSKIQSPIFQEKHGALKYNTGLRVGNTHNENCKLLIGKASDEKPSNLTPCKKFRREIIR